MILPLLSAILGIIAFLPANLYFLGFIFLAPLFVFFMKEKKLWRLVLGAFIFRIVFGLGTVYFTLEPITWISSSLIFIGLPISFFIFRKAINFFFAKYLADFSIRQSAIGYYAPLFSLPFFWILFDYLEAQYSFLPTYLITAGNIFGSSPFAGLAGIGGLVFLTFFVAVINAIVANFILKFKTLKPKNLLYYSLAVFFIILAAWQISSYQIRKNSADYNNRKNSLKIAAVSVNDRFNFGEIESLKNELAGKKIDLTVFPEDMLDDDYGLTSLNLYQKLAERLDIHLIAAFNTRQSGRKYVSAILFNEKGDVAGVYNKNRLTFVGEYWPFGNWRPALYDWLKEKNPKTGKYAVFNPQDPPLRGDKKILSLNRQENIVNFASLICLEIQYPDDLKEYKKMGAKFIINPASNRWIDLGTKHFLYLTNNLRKIESVWLKMPIISGGVKDFAGVITPDGKIDIVDYENGDKNYGIFFGEIKY